MSDETTASDGDASEASSEASVPERTEETAPDGLGRRTGTAIVEFYQSWISPALPPSCRFQPTCSEYTRIAIERYGLIRGSWMGLKRVLRCHPFHPGGHDPVP